MSRQVFCKKYRVELPGLDAPPLPGELGEEVFNNISAKAWSEWQTLQTMLINEHHLNMLDPEARTFLKEQMRNFLSNESHEKPAGYIPTD
jgi:Fe-S cluster biosynthesis and repair protein YggX